MKIEQLQKMEEFANERLRPVKVLNHHRMRLWLLVRDLSHVINGELDHMKITDSAGNLILDTFASEPRQMSIGDGMELDDVC